MNLFYDHLVDTDIPALAWQKMWRSRGALPITEKYRAIIVLYLTSFLIQTF